MENTLAHDVCLQALGKGVSARILSSIETQEIVGKIEALYSWHEESSARPLWERFREARSRHDPDAWKDVSGLIGDEGVIMIIEDYHGLSAVSISSGLAVSAILADTVGFVFYITRKDADYVLCLNDHGMLIGTGRASGWISSQ